MNQETDRHLNIRVLPNSLIWFDGMRGLVESERALDQNVQVLFNKKVSVNTPTLIQFNVQINDPALLVLCYSTITVAASRRVQVEL